MSISSGSSIIDLRILDPTKQDPSLTQMHVHASSIHKDKIGCYNIQNRYSYTIAMEMFIREKFTFLSFQEPFGSQYSQTDSWEKKKKGDMGNLRIKCFELKHQIVLLDNIKWEGKEEDDFRSYMDGRIVTLVLKFGKTIGGTHQRLGIVSIYGIAGMGLSQKEASKKETSITLIVLISDIKERWTTSRYPDICIVYLGDFQETILMENSDNQWVRNGINNNNLDRMSQVLNSNIKKILTSILSVENIKEKVRTIHELINEEKDMWEEHI